MSSFLNAVSAVLQKDGKISIFTAIVPQIQGGHQKKLLALWTLANGKFFLILCLRPFGVAGKGLMSPDAAEKIWHTKRIRIIDIKEFVFILRKILIGF